MSFVWAAAESYMATAASGNPPCASVSLNGKLIPKEKSVEKHTECGLQSLCLISSL